MIDLPDKVFSAYSHFIAHQKIAGKKMEEQQKKSGSACAQ